MNPPDQLADMNCAANRKIAKGRPLRFNWLANDGPGTNVDKVRWFTGLTCVKTFGLHDMGRGRVHLKNRSPA